MKKQIKEPIQFKGLKMPDTNKIENYWNSEYPIYVEVPEGYWTITTTVDNFDEE